MYINQTENTKDEQYISPTPPDKAGLVNTPQTDGPDTAPKTDFDQNDFPKSGIFSPALPESGDVALKFYDENDPAVKAEIKNMKKLGMMDCETCKNRRYVDGSNDPGVSFKTPGKISPGESAAVVRSHEQEHVSRESAKAKTEDRKIVSQSVSLSVDFCPECGRSYVSGGQTRTVTKNDNSSDYFKDKMKNMAEGLFGKFMDAKV